MTFKFEQVDKGKQFGKNIKRGDGELNLSALKSWCPESVKKLSYVFH